MATQSKKVTEVEQKEPSLQDLMGAITGVGQELKGVSNKVDSIERRVTALERKPELKTRIVHQERVNGNGHVQEAQLPASQPTARQPVRPPAPVRHDDNGEDEAILAGNWEKVVTRSRCYRVDVTKVRSAQYSDCWKLLLRLRGQRRPAVICGFEGTQDLIERMKEVWPAVNQDIFDEALFVEQWAERRQSDPQATLPIIYSEDVLFEVDWFKTAPNSQGHTFINVEGVYPLND